MLAFKSLTPEALLKEVAQHLRDMSTKAVHRSAALNLHVIACDLEEAVILPANSDVNHNSNEDRTPPSIGRGGFSRRATPAEKAKATRDSAKPWSERRK